MKTNTHQTHDLVARVQCDGGCAHDTDVSQYMELFLAEGEDAVKKLVEDDQTYCYYVRLEGKGAWTML